MRGLARSGRVVGVDGHGVRSSLWSLSSAFQPNAERHLAKAGGSKGKLRGFPTLETEQGEVDRAEHERRSAQVQRGRLGRRLAGAWGLAP